MKQERPFKTGPEMYQLLTDLMKKHSIKAFESVYDSNTFYQNMCV